MLDLGSFVRYCPNLKTTAFYGTLKYACPEVQLLFLEPQNMGFLSIFQAVPFDLEAQEVWSIGMLLFSVTFGIDLFKNQREIFQLDIKKRIESLTNSKNPRYRMISDELKATILRLLHRDPRQRPRIKDILKLPYFQTKLVDIYQWAGADRLPTPPVEESKPKKSFIARGFENGILYWKTKFTRSNRV
jgi:serine/threonine protein kinase